MERSVGDDDDSDWSSESSNVQQKHRETVRTPQRDPGNLPTQQMQSEPPSPASGNIAQAMDVSIPADYMPLFTTASSGKPISVSKSAETRTRHLFQQGDRHKRPAEDDLGPPIQRLCPNSRSTPEESGESSSGRSVFRVPAQPTRVTRTEEAMELEEDEDVVPMRRPRANAVMIPSVQLAAMRRQKQYVNPLGNRPEAGTSEICAFVASKSPNRKSPRSLTPTPLQRSRLRRNSVPESYRSYQQNDPEDLADSFEAHLGISGPERIVMNEFSMIRRKSPIRKIYHNIGIVVYIDTIYVKVDNELHARGERRFVMMNETAPDCRFLVCVPIRRIRDSNEDLDTTSNQEIRVGYRVRVNGGTVQVHGTDIHVHVGINSSVDILTNNCRPVAPSEHTFVMKPYVVPLSTINQLRPGSLPELGFRGEPDLAIVKCYLIDLGRKSYLGCRSCYYKFNRSQKKWDKCPNAACSEKGVGVKCIYSLFHLADYTGQIQVEVGDELMKRFLSDNGFDDIEHSDRYANPEEQHEPSQWEFKPWMLKLRRRAVGTVEWECIDIKEVDWVAYNDFVERRASKLGLRIALQYPRGMRRPVVVMQPGVREPIAHGSFEEEDAIEIVKQERAQQMELGVAASGAEPMEEEAVEDSNE